MSARVSSILTQVFTIWPEWTTNNLPNLDGKVAIVTGVTSGLGKETAKQLARKGAHVFCLGRSKDKTMKAITEIKEELGGGGVEAKLDFIIADLMDLKSVEAGAEAFLARKLPLHILVNNAGIYGIPFALSKDGLESQYATNHFASVAFTNKLLPVLEASQPSRIVNVSSLSHFGAKESGLESMNDEKLYDKEGRYAQTKLANIHYTNHLQTLLDARAKAEGKECQIFANSCHPGVVSTEMAPKAGFDFFKAKILLPLISINVQKGALTQLFVAASKDIEEKKVKASFFVPYGVKVDPSTEAQDGKMAEALWNGTVKILEEKLPGYKSFV